MVKKISGTGPTRPTGSASGVKGNEAVEGKKVDSVGKVGDVAARTGVERLRPQTRPMTAAERDHLMSLVDEEAEKMFGDGKLPEKRRRTLTQSVKLTLAGGLISIEEDEEKK